MASIDASASPRHDHGGWPAARAHAQRPWSRCRHLLRSPSSSPHTPAAPFQHRASDLAVRRLCTKQRRAWCQEVQKGIGATFSAFPGVIDHMNGPHSQRESGIGETGDMVLRLDMPSAGYRKGRPPSRRKREKKFFPDTTFYIRLESMLRRFRETIGRGQATPPAPLRAGGRSRRARAPLCTFPGMGRG